MQPRLRFKNLTNNWKNRKLGSIARVFDGTHQTPHYVSKRKLPHVNDIVMTRIGTIGAVNILKRNDIAYYVSLALIHPNNRFILPYFLLYLVQSTNFQRELWRRTLQIAFPQKINKSEIPKVPVNIPSLSEQRLIGRFFAKLDKLISLQQAKCVLLKKQKRGYLQKFFRNIDWQKSHFYRLSDLCNIKTGSKNAQDNVPNGKYPFFDRSTELKHLNTYDYDEETIIYAGEGEKFLPRYFNGKYSLHQRAYSLYNFKKNLIDVKYLYEFLLTQSNRFVRYAVGTTVKSLRMECFKHIKIPKMPLNKQRKIGQFLNINDELLNLYQHKLQYLRKLKKAYLQKMFC